jgi:hypothetical protein
MVSIVRAKTGGSDRATGIHPVFTYWEDGMMPGPFPVVQPLGES